MAGDGEVAGVAEATGVRGVAVVAEVGVVGVSAGGAVSISISHLYNQIIKLYSI